MKLSRDEEELRESSSDLAELGEGYLDKEEGKALAFAALNYLFSGVEDDRTRKIIAASFNKVIKDGGHLIMTITEKWKIEGKHEVAKEMIDEGMSDELIVKYTKLPIEEIQKLRESN